MPLPALVAFGAGGAGLVTFAIAGGLALGEDRALADRCNGSCSESDLSKLDRRTTVADVGIAVAAAGVATGLVLFFVLRDRKKEPEGTSRLRPTHQGLSLSF